MADHSSIEWTDATWQPITGCSVVSPGCTNCYAMKLAGTRLRHHPSRKGLTVNSKSGPVWNGKVRFNEQWLTQPLGWKSPRRIFVCAHGDLFHDDVPEEWIDRVFAVMALAPQHTFQVLTKRAARMRSYMAVAQKRIVKVTAGGNENVSVHTGQAYRSTTHLGGKVAWPLPNVWLGVSTEDQRRADERIPHLLATPAAIRFVSAEPLLGPIDLTKIGGTACLAHEGACCGDRPWLDALRGIQGCSRAGAYGYPERGQMPRGLDWIIVGGESGDAARPMHPDWARSLRDQCVSASVPFFFKQWGHFSPVPSLTNFPGRRSFKNGTHVFRRENLDDVVMVAFGKKGAGRALDGIEHNGMPEVRQ